MATNRVYTKKKWFGKFMLYPRINSVASLLFNSSWCIFLWLRTENKMNWPHSNNKIWKKLPVNITSKSKKIIQLFCLANEIVCYSTHRNYTYLRYWSFHHPSCQYIKLSEFVLFLINFLWFYGYNQFTFPQCLKT